MSYSKGIMWLDDCRIPFVDEGDIQSAKPGSLNATGEFSSFGFKSGNELNQQGRFTPNLLVCDDMLNDGSVSKSGGKTEYNWDLSKNDNPTKITKNIKSGIPFSDKGSNSRFYNLDKWFDNMLDGL